MSSRIELIIGLVVAILLAVGLTLFASHYMSLEKAAAQNELRGGVLESASAGVEEGQRIDDHQAEIDSGLAQGRERFNNVISEAETHEPQTASRAATRVPDSVRNAYRERRLARERLGCAGQQCQKDDKADAATQR